MDSHNCVHQEEEIARLMDKHRELEKNLEGIYADSLRIELNKTNAEIRQLYNTIKREKWVSMCKELDVKTPNTKLWKLLKAHFLTSNVISNNNNSKMIDDSDVADAFGGEYYQRSSRLDFHQKDKHTSKESRKIIHSCKLRPSKQKLFNQPLEMAELITQYLR